MSLKPRTGDAPDASLLGNDDRELSLASTWAERRVALIFLRHFG